MGRLVQETLKGTVTHVSPPADAVCASDRPVRPRWIVVPRYQAGAPATMLPMPRAHGFMRLVANAFNYQVHRERGFELLADVVSECDCYEFVYGDLADACRAFQELDGRA
jgi:hypothetical protein